MTPKQFVIRFMIGSLILLGVVALFNRVVDPFWYYRDIELTGFNTIKPKFQRYERHVKPALLIRDQPEAIILGSSFAEVGFDPTDPHFTDNGHLKSMNLALAGASWEMVQCDFEFAVTHSRIKRALIGFHPGNLPTANCAKDFPSLGEISTGELLLSDRALLASMQTIREQRNEQPSHTREGMYFYSRRTPGVDDRFGIYFHKRQNANPQCLNPDVAPDAFSDLTGQHQFDLSGLRHMISIAKTHGVELVLFAYPRHAYNFELDRQCGEPDKSWQGLRQIATLVEAESAGSAQVHVWQFYDYNDVTAEPIGVRAKYWQDPEHFNFELGSLMLQAMFGSPDSPARFGRPLISGNIDSDYTDFLAQRERYTKQHPELQQDFQKLLLK